MRDSAILQETQYPSLAIASVITDRARLVDMLTPFRLWKHSMGGD